MGSHGIRDRVAIVGMGCTNFGEHWDKSVDDMLIDSSEAAMTSAGVTRDDVDAYWLGTMGSGVSGLTLSRALRLENKPVTRLENMCATGSEALRNACYAVASGVFDVAMAIGVEKLKDSGFSGLTGNPLPGDGTLPETTAPARFSLLAPAYANKYGLDDAAMKEVLTRIAWKNHSNGARNSRAQFRKEVSKETIAAAPSIAGMLGVFDCSGVSDGSAAAIVVRAEDAHRYTDQPLYVKGLSFVAGPARGNIDPSYDFTTFTEVVAAADDAYAQAGVEDPRTELAMAEVHDCFTPTELVLMEDLGFSDRGVAWKEVLAGTFDLHGELPVNPDGGLKAFGHPIGASGLRMMFECWLQLRREAPEDRRITSLDNGRKLALTHNLGGQPGECVSFVSVVGTEPVRVTLHLSDDEKLAAAAAYAAARNAGDLDAVVALSEPDLVVWHNHDDAEVDAAHSERTVSWLRNRVPDLLWEDVVILPTPDGYVRRTVLTGNAPAGPLRIHSCMVVTLSEAGKIARIDEYLDTASLGPLADG